MNEIWSSVVRVDVKKYLPHIGPLRIDCFVGVCLLWQDWIWNKTKLLIVSLKYNVFGCKIEVKFQGIFEEYEIELSKVYSFLLEQFLLH